VASYYLDSSALFKRYVIEPGSLWIVDTCDPTRANEVFVSRISAVEVSSGLSRQTPALTPDILDVALAFLRDDLQYQFQVIEFTPELAERAMEAARLHRLRGYDAVQLATALAVREVQNALGHPQVTFVSADLDLNDAARAEGFRVEDPGLHP
jgi:predicted nucleic acid-binding protein